jgi:hypothetical protein
MALRATLDCDLGTAHDRAYQEDGQEWSGQGDPANALGNETGLNS